MSLFRGRRRQRGRVAIFAELAFLLIGFGLLGWAGFMTGQRILYSSWQEYRFAEELEGDRPTVRGYLRYVSTGSGSSSPAESTVAKEETPVAEQEPPKTAPSKQQKRLKRADLIGRIEIPRIKVSAVIKEGVDTKTLSRAVGHVPYTPLPGEKGNVGVAAHRDTFFRGLRDIRQGDVIRVVTHDGIYKYEVDSLKIVWPKNVEVLDPTPDERITLVTCYPFNYVGSAPKRFIVQGKQVGFEQLSAASEKGASKAVSARSGT